MESNLTPQQRCAWVPAGDALYTAYHDWEWGRPSRDDRHLFEMLVLEGFQAGLSWRTILSKRPAFREAFGGFDPGKVARYDEKKVLSLMNNPGIVRNRLKIRAAVSNAQAFLEIAREYGSFSNYLWGFVNHEPVTLLALPVPARTPLSDHISLDLIRRGMRFAGSTIIYAYLQAVGVVNDHEPGCFLSGSQLLLPNKTIEPEV